MEDLPAATHDRFAEGVHWRRREKGGTAFTVRPGRTERREGRKSTDVDHPRQGWRCCGKKTPSSKIRKKWAGDVRRLHVTGLAAHKRGKMVR